MGEREAVEEQGQQAVEAQVQRRQLQRADVQVAEDAAEGHAGVVHGLGEGEEGARRQEGEWAREGRGWVSQ